MLDRLMLKLKAQPALVSSFALYDDFLPSHRISINNSNNFKSDEINNNSGINSCKVQSNDSGGADDNSAIVSYSNKNDLVKSDYSTGNHAMVLIGMRKTTEGEYFLLLQNW